MSDAMKKSKIKLLAHAVRSELISEHGMTFHDAFHEIEAEVIGTCVREHRSVSVAARKLGLSRDTLNSRLRKYGYRFDNAGRKMWELANLITPEGDVIKVVKPEPEEKPNT